MLIRPPSTTIRRVVTRDAAWRPELTPRLDRETRKDAFVCAGWGTLLFASGADTRRPSLHGPATRLAASEHDEPRVIPRTKVRFAGRDANLGHVFPDGPRETTGLRRRIDGVALRFKPEDG